MRQNKQKEHAVHYFDPRVLENYFRNEILLTFELSGRQAGKLIAKRELEMKQNELQAMLHDANQLIKRQVDLYNIKRSVKDDNN